MKLFESNRFNRKSPVANRKRDGGSVLVIVLMVCIGLISIALYFANSMSLELRASDNRTSGLSSEQAIEGAARYVTAVLSTYATNGAMPTLDEYHAEAVPVGNSTKPEENARFWLIGRDLSGAVQTEPHFALLDESSKLDLNATWINADVLSTNLMTGMNSEFAEAIIDWRETNSTSGDTVNYGQAGYLAKHSPFETVGELRLVYGATIEDLIGDDANRNGVLDANETDLYGNGHTDPGLLEYFTAYSRQPNTLSDGTSLTNVNDQAGLYSLLELRLGQSRAQEITNRLAVALNTGGGGGGGGPGGGGGGGGGQAQTLASLLDFCLKSGISADEFAQVYDDLTATTNTYTVGRVNVNTAPAAVLACIPGLNADLAQQLVNYRESNAINLNSFGWIVDALSGETAALQTLAAGDYITAKTYQFTADIAAVGPFGRGYRRVRFIFDTSDGTPKIIYRQDLTRLGWALGKQTRETWVTMNTR